MNEKEETARRRHKHMMLAMALVVLLVLVVMPLPAIGSEVDGSSEEPAVAAETVAPAEEMVVPAEEPAEVTQPEEVAEPQVEETVEDEEVVEPAAEEQLDGEEAVEAPSEEKEKVGDEQVSLERAPQAALSEEALVEAIGVSPQAQQLVDNDNWHLGIVCPPPPCISLDKSGPAQACVGVDITYTYTITNTGGYPLANVKLTDDKFGDIGNWPALAVGSNVVATKTVTVGEDWETPYVNKALATADVVTCTRSVGANSSIQGSDPSIPTAVSATDQHSLMVLHPSISLEKSVSPTSAEVGDTVTYTYEVTNTGDTALTDVVLNDDQLGAIAEWASIEALGTETATKTYVVVEEDIPEIVNTATVTAVTPCQTEVSDTATVTLPVTEAETPVKPAPERPAETPKPAETPAPETPATVAPAPEAPAPEIPTPETPVTPAMLPTVVETVVAATEAPSATLPRTGGDFMGLLIAGLLLLTLGLLGITAGAVLRRRSLKA